jgi:putative NADH-flavin reductase
MKVALVGATGNVGTRILKELVSRGHAVTALARNVDTIAAQPGVTARAIDASDATALADALRGHDAVISALRFAPTDADALIKAVRSSGVTRYLVVGGAGTLTPPGSDKNLIDSGKIPEAWMPEVGGGARFLARLKQEPEGLDWTFLSPSAMFSQGERTGHFRLAKDELLTAADGKSHISYEDYAIALVDEIEHPAHVRQRFTVGY